MRRLAESLVSAAVLAVLTIGAVGAGVSTVEKAKQVATVPSLDSQLAEQLAKHGYPSDTTVSGALDTIKKSEQLNNESLAKILAELDK